MGEANRRAAFELIQGGATPAPSIHLSASERAAVAKFLDFALEDIAYQTSKLSAEQGISKRKIALSSALIEAYVRNLRAGVDQMTEIKTVEPEQAG